MLLRRYIHGPGIDESLVWYEGNGTGSKTWLYGDHLGSIAATANSAGTSTATYTYGPFGEPNAATGIRFRYTGQQLLGQLGLYYYKARFYSPTLDRFLQTDPVGYQSDLNLYAYVGNDPVNRTDPSGLFFLQVVGGAVNAGIGAVASFALGEDITLRNLATDFGVGAASSGAVVAGRLATLTQITNTGLGKAATAGVGEVYKGVADGQKSPTQITGYAVGNAALNASGAVGKVGTIIAQKSGLSLPTNSTANGILSNAFSVPAGVGAGVAIGATANNLGASSNTGIGFSASQSGSFSSGLSSITRKP